MGKILISFPLCGLAFERSVAERLEYIIAADVVKNTFGFQNLHESGKYNDALYTEAAEKVNTLEMQRKLPKKFQPDNLQHIFFILACERKGIVFADISDAFGRYEVFNRFHVAYEKNFGKDTWATFPKDILFEVKGGKFDYDLFSLICAIGSCIPHNAQFRHITKEQIAVRMQGFKKKSVRDELLNRSKYDSSIPNLASIPELMHPKKVERLRDKARERGFFEIYTYNQRTTYYSTSLSQKELVRAVLDLKTRREKSYLEKINAEAEYREEMNRLREAAKMRRSRSLMRVI